MYIYCQLGFKAVFCKKKKKKRVTFIDSKCVIPDIGTLDRNFDRDQYT